MADETPPTSGERAYVDNGARTAAALITAMLNSDYALAAQLTNEATSGQRTAALLWTVTHIAESFRRVPEGQPQWEDVALRMRTMDGDW